jgi:transposase
MSFTSDTILVAIELSNSLWLVGTRMPGTQKSHMHRV